MHKALDHMVNMYDVHTDYVCIKEPEGTFFHFLICNLCAYTHILFLDGSVVLLLFSIIGQFDCARGWSNANMAANQ